MNGGMPLSHLTPEQIRVLFSETAVASWSINSSGYVLEPEQWTKLTGQTANEMGADGWLKVIHLNDRARVEAAWSTAVSHEQHFNTDYRIRCSDGIFRWFNVRGIPLRSPDGDVDQWVGLFLEIPGVARFRENSETSSRNANRSSLEKLAPPQLRAARAFLGWSASELAGRAGVSVSTIRRFEQGDDHGHLGQRSSTLLIECLLGAGVEITSGADGSMIVKILRSSD